MKLAYASFDFVVINIIAIPFAMVDPMLWTWYSLCIALAFVLRLGMEHKRHKLTKASLLYQSICTVTWSFFMILVWNYTFPKGRPGFEIYLFINSLFAVFMVSQFEEIFESGFKSWARTKLSTFLATEKANVTNTPPPIKPEEQL